MISICLSQGKDSAQPCECQRYEQAAGHTHDTHAFFCLKDIKSFHHYSVCLVSCAIFVDSTHYQ